MIASGPAALAVNFLAGIPASQTALLRRSRVKTLVVSTLLFFTPLAAYWPTTFHNYGMRDDYSKLREAHEEPGKVLHFCASNARPIYGYLLQASFQRIDTVRDMQWLRLLGSFLLGGLALASYSGLRKMGWPTGMSLTLACWIALLPGAQVIAGWMIAWPYAVAALVALAAFFLAEDAIRAGFRGRLAAVRLTAGVVLLGASALIYQSNAFFYLVPLTAALVMRRSGSAKNTLQWVITHLVLVVVALAAAYFAMRALYALGIFEKSRRIAFEHHCGAKIAWFLRAPLPNSLSLFALNDDNGLGRPAYLAGATVVGLILAAGAAAEWWRCGWRRGLLWIAGLLGLPVLAFSISLIAAEHYSTYRTTYAMTAVLLCFLLASMRTLTGWLGGRGRTVAAAMVLTLAFLVARHQGYALLAAPQGREWQLIREGAAQVKLDNARPRVFVIVPVPADASTARTYHDEFGSLSSNSDWVPKEMFKRAMHDLHPGMPEVWRHYEFSSGDEPADLRQFDVVVDMRQLRRFRSKN